MAEKDGGLMSDPYASSSAPAPSSGSSFPSLPSFGGASESYGSGDYHLPATAAPIPTPNFLFEDSYDAGFRRSWGERLTYHVGCAYLGGLVGGGAAGLAQGLRESAGERRRIRVNAVLNATGKRGPTLGNSLGCIGACATARTHLSVARGATCGMHAEPPACVVGRPQTIY